MFPSLPSPTSGPGRSRASAPCAAKTRAHDALAWDPTDEKSIRFAERSVRRYHHKLYGAQGLAVVIGQ